jgi:hypothetical protein
MSTPIIFKSFTVEDAGGGNPTVYNMNPVDARELGITPNTTTVDDGQTIMDNVDANFTFDSRDLDVFSDTRITKDAADQKGLCRLTWNSDVTNGSVRLDNVRLSATDKIEDVRMAQLVASKRATASPITFV